MMRQTYISRLDFARQFGYMPAADMCGMTFYDPGTGLPTEHFIFTEEQHIPAQQKEILELERIFALPSEPMGTDTHQVEPGPDGDSTQYSR